MAVAVSELVTGVKDLNPELTSSQDTRIIRWINSERRYLLNEVDVRVAEMLLTAAQDDLTSGEELVELPDDFIELADDGVQILNDDSLYVPATKVDRSQFRVWDATEKTYSNDEYYYALRDQFLVLRPTPDGNTTNGIQIDYWAHPDDWASDANIDVEFIRFREILEVGAALRSGIRYEDGRTELERHYGRLLDQFRRDFSQRDRTPRKWKSIRSNKSQSGSRPQFGRVRK